MSTTARLGLFTTHLRMTSSEGGHAHHTASHVAFQLTFFSHLYSPAAIQLPARVSGEVCRLSGNQRVQKLGEIRLQIAPPPTFNHRLRRKCQGWSQADLIFTSWVFLIILWDRLQCHWSPEVEGGAPILFELPCTACW